MNAFGGGCLLSHKNGSCYIWRGFAPIFAGKINTKKAGPSLKERLEIF
jgi:hypothetical protein